MHEDDKSAILIPFLSFIQNVIFVHRIKPKNCRKVRGNNSFVLIFSFGYSILLVGTY